MAKKIKELPAGAPLAALQRHVEQTAAGRGFGRQNGPQKCLILGEEVGELFKAVRALEGIPVGRHSRIPEVADELADVLLYVCSIANYYGVDLEKAFRAKDKVLSRRACRPHKARAAAR